MTRTVSGWDGRRRHECLPRCWRRRPLDLSRDGSRRPAATVVRYAGDGSIDSGFGKQGIVAADFHGADDAGHGIAFAARGRRS